MEAASKREIARKFKEKKPLRGAYAVRCLASGQVWVGSSRNLEATRNGLWFSLRLNGHRDKTLQQEWNGHGEPAFEYEILERLDEDTPDLVVGDLLKKVSACWQSRLSAKPLL